MRLTKSSMPYLLQKLKTYQVEGSVSYPMGERLSYVSVVLMVVQHWRSNQGRIGSSLDMTSNHI